MCPACIGSALLLLSGSGSAGGVAAFSLWSFTRHKRRSQQSAIDDSSADVDHDDRRGDEQVPLIPNGVGASDG